GHGQVFLVLQQRAQPDPHQVLVVDQRHRDHRSSLGARGKRARTVYVPRSRSGPACSTPPTASTRRRIPEMPIPTVSPAASAWLVTVTCTASRRRSMLTLAAGCGQCLTTFVSDSCSTR